jgi:3-hydroxyisobutyrate dehydrogenase-like beta-hydroxyacid dehydrogenase
VIMKIGILGTGVVGQSLAKGFAKHGYAVRGETLLRGGGVSIVSHCGCRFF